VKILHQRAMAAVGLAVMAAPAVAVASVRVAYQGQSVTTNAPVVHIPRGTLVPLRAVSEALGGRLEWDRATKRAVVRHGRRMLEVDQQAQAISLNGRPLAGMIGPRTTQGYLLVPLAAVERLFAVDGRWSPGERLLHFAAVPGGGGTPGGDEGVTGAGVRLRLTADKTSYTAGAPVALTLTVTNGSRSPVTLEFSSGQKVDFEVRRGGQAVWRWSADRMFTQALTSLTLAPGERKVFTETWKQQDNNGQPVPAGSYEAIATLTTMKKPQPRSGAVVVRIGG
jgi:hypothetical protein